MPTVPLFPPPAKRDGIAASNALPPLLQTPSGLAILELQGTVLAEYGEAGDFTASRLPLGKLVFPSADGQAAVSDSDWDGKRVFLFVGKHQRMTGEVKKLAKPLAIVRRRTPDGADDATPARDELEIAEIARFKVLFAHRPEPMGGEQEKVVLEE